MKRRRFTEEQFAFALRQAEAGASVAEVIRRVGVSEHTLCRRRHQPFAQRCHYQERNAKAQL